MARFRCLFYLPWLLGWPGAAIHACVVHRDLSRQHHHGWRRPHHRLRYRPALDVSGMTQTGTVLGTLSYMSPEQAQGQPVGPASDIFSLGTVLAFAATSINPFAADTMAATVLRIIGPSPVVDELPAELRSLIVSCWSHDPEQRPSLNPLSDPSRARQYTMSGK